MLSRLRLSRTHERTLRSLPYYTPITLSPLRYAW